MKEEEKEGGRKERKKYEESDSLMTMKPPCQGLGSVT
jgi:hypothetical protein